MKTIFAAATCCMVFCWANGQYKGDIGRGTIILSLITKDSIVIAADSKVTFTNLPDATIKKIARYKNTYYSFSGFTTIRDMEGHVFYSMKDTIQSALKHNKSFEEIVIALKKKFTNSIPIIYENSSQLSLEQLFPNRRFIELSLVRYNNNVPQYLFGSFYIDGPSLLKCSFRFQPDDSLSHTYPLINSNGHHYAVDSFLQKNPAYFKEGITLQKLVYLINLEAKKYPDAIGYPVDVVIIKPKSKKWLRYLL